MKAAKVAIPGQNVPTQAETESNPDEAIAFAKAGQARPIRKIRAFVPAAELDRPDPDRPPEAFVNASEYDMDMTDAIDLDNKGELQRSVLTEAGWYCPMNTKKLRIERRKNNQPEMVEILGGE